ncbi:hypothetical protein N7490_006054 [Penicillium lividum]|nr:hypothetical protein N7490_006054 [Penicillium lividum]
MKTRLDFQKFESPRDDDFLHRLLNDPRASLNSSWAFKQPVTREDSHSIREDLLRTEWSYKSATPIGVVYLKHIGNLLDHHRCVELNVAIFWTFLGSGFTHASMEWVLSRAFEGNHIHRVELNLAEWSAPGLQFGSRYLSFKVEGIKRNRLWREGRYWDDFFLGVGKSDWERYKDRELA